MGEEKIPPIPYTFNSIFHDMKKLHLETARWYLYTLNILHFK